MSLMHPVSENHYRYSEKVFLTNPGFSFLKCQQNIGKKNEHYPPMPTHKCMQRAHLSVGENAKSPKHLPI